MSGTLTDETDWMGELEGSLNRINIQLMGEDNPMGYEVLDALMAIRDLLKANLKETGE